MSSRKNKEIDTDKLIQKLRHNVLGNGAPEAAEQEGEMVSRSDLEQLEEKLNRMSCQLSALAQTSPDGDIATTLEDDYEALAERVRRLEVRLDEAPANVAIGEFPDLSGLRGEILALAARLKRSQQKIGRNSRELTKLQQQGESIIGIKASLGNLQNEQEQTGEATRRSLRTLKSDLGDLQTVTSTAAHINTVDQLRATVDDLKQDLGKKSDRPELEAIQQILTSFADRVTPLEEAIRQQKEGLATSQTKLTQVEQDYGNSIRGQHEGIVALQDRLSQVEQNKELIEQIQKSLQVHENAFADRDKAITEVQSKVSSYNQAREQLQQKIVDIDTRLSELQPAILKELRETSHALEENLSLSSKTQESHEQRLINIEEAARKFETLTSDLQQNLSSDLEAKYREAVSSASERSDYLERKLEEQIQQFAAGLGELVGSADHLGGWGTVLSSVEQLQAHLPQLESSKQVDFHALAKTLASLDREKLVVRMRRLERTLRDLKKIYDVHDLLTKFRMEQRLLAE
jgi:DNA repair exonuclease SbcCD ATPase subunit